MAITVQQLEAEPSEYPDAPDDLSSDAAAIDPAIIWERIESYVAHRWAEREVSWVVEGPGEWVPPLTPVTIATVEMWSTGAEMWEPVALSPSPLGGYWLPASGPYRFTGAAGGAEVPPIVLEAYRRLAEYFAAAAGDDPARTGSRSHEVSIGDLRESIARSPSWIGMALQNSGAADLLRQYRRAA